MRYLVATKKTQGEKKGDFSFVREGEIVRMSSVCDNACSCGCGRALSGIKSFKSTTSFKVFDDPTMTLEEFADVLLASYVAAGWTFKKDPTVEDRRMIAREAGALASIARSFPVGTVLGINGSRVYKRGGAR